MMTKLKKYFRFVFSAIEGNYKLIYRKKYGHNRQGVHPNMHYCTAQALCYRMCLNYCKCSTCWMDMKGMNKDASVTRREEEQEMELFREQRILHTPLCGVLIVYVLVLVGCEKKWSC